MVAEGSLPALAGLVERGRWIGLDSPARHFAAGSFWTLYTGLPVGDHGIYYPFQWSPWEQRLRVVHDLPQPESVWERLARSGRRCLVVDPYEAVPPRGVEGLAVSGCQFRNRVVLPRWSRGDARGIAVGESPSIDEVFGQPSAAGLLKMRRGLLGAPERAAVLVSRYLAQGPVDLLWVGFPSVHLGGHWFWDLSTLAEGTAAGDARVLAGTLRDLYRDCDRALGRVIASLPDDADVIVHSALGMGPNTSLADLLPDMLSAVIAGDPSERANGAGGALWRIRSAVPTDLRARVAGLLPQRLALELTVRMELRGVDWATTVAFASPGDFHGHVRLNVRGRGSRGPWRSLCDHRTRGKRAARRCRRDRRGVARAGRTRASGCAPAARVRRLYRPPRSCLTMASSVASARRGFVPAERGR